MTTKLILTLLTSITLSAFAQVIMKYGMSRPHVQTAIEGANVGNIVLTVGTNPGVLTGLSMYVLSVAFWLSVLAKLDVSQAYPFVGLGFLITMAFGFMFLGESLSLQRVFGTVLVATGVYLVART